MHRISLPIINATVTPDTRADYLALLRRAKADRVFLVVTDFCATPQEEAAELASLAENLAYFSSHGLETAIWIGTTVGHGCSLQLLNQNTDMGNTMQPLVNLSGEPLGETRCPTDPVFRERLCQRIAKYAALDLKLILLDDDFRLSQHGKEFCCTCDRHMAMMRESCGESISREDLRHLVFESKTGKYRDAWLKAQGDSLRTLAADLRRAVDQVDEEVVLAMCCSHSIWDIDGTTPLELSAILAGKNKPVARLLGAPYWAAMTSKTLIGVFEHARMFASFCEGREMELMAEGDVYPRPRHQVPSSYLELYDAVIRADGHYDGILKYMIDYTASPTYETAYIDRHAYALPLGEAISELFANKRGIGVSVPTRPGLLKDADLSLGVASDCYPYPLAGTMLGSCGIPTVYTRDGICSAVFGEEARHIDPSELRRGAILDGIAACLLTERGVDVGLEAGAREFAWQKPSFLVSADGKDTVGVRNSEGNYLTAPLSPTAVMREWMLAGGEKLPFAYRYENADGQRFLVFLADMMSLPRNAAIFHPYLHQTLLTQHIEWISERKLPASAMGNMDLYIMCAEGEGRMAVGLFNCHADSILHPVIRLDRPVKSIRFINCHGHAEGNTVILDAPLHAFELAAFEVE